MTFDYLARDASEEVRGLRILARTAHGPCLPFITSLSIDVAQAEVIRHAMNQALSDLPDVAEALAISQVLAAHQDDYQILLDYERQAAEQGLPSLAFKTGGNLLARWADAVLQALRAPARALRRL